MPISSSRSVVLLKEIRNINYKIHKKQRQQHVRYNYINLNTSSCLLSPV